MMASKISIKLKRVGKFWIANIFIDKEVIATQGKSLEECLDNLKEAILGWIEAFEKDYKK